jgi:hypothetical protein
LSKEKNFELVQTFTNTPKSFYKIIDLYFLVEHIQL